MNNAKFFASFSDSVVFVRDALKPLNHKFSVGGSPVNAGERKYTQTVFVRWADGPSYNEVKEFLTSLNLQLHANRGPVQFLLTRSA